MEWISIKEQYPNKGKRVIIYGQWADPGFKDDEDYEPHRHAREGEFDCFDIAEGPIWRSNGGRFYEVTHWMDLPGHPKN